MPSPRHAVNEALSTGRLPDVTAIHAHRHHASTPEASTLAGLARILSRLYGDHAPTESTLKKWSGLGIFAACEVKGKREVSRGAGRPGLRLDVQKAIALVLTQWPHLTDTSSDSVAASPSPAATSTQASVDRPSDSSPREALPAAELTAIANQLTALQEEMRAVRREVAQFSALRNNLVTRLDEVVARAQEIVALGSRNSSGGHDPLVEARRDRDMGVLKSMMGEILQALEGRS